MLYEMTTATHPFKRETGGADAVGHHRRRAARPRRRRARRSPCRRAPADSAGCWRRRHGNATRTRRISRRSCGRSAGHLSEATMATVPGHSWAMAKMADSGRWRASRWSPPECCWERRSHHRRPQQGSTSSSRSQLIPGYQGAPTWSPDGKQIAYHAEVDGVVQIFTRTPGLPSTSARSRNRRFDCFIAAWSGRRAHLLSLPDARDTVGLVAGQPDVWRQARTRHRECRTGGHFALRPDRVFPPRARGLGINTTFWTKSLPDGKEER